MDIDTNDAAVVGNALRKVIAVSAEALERLPQRAHDGSVKTNVLESWQVMVDGTPMPVEWASQAADKPRAWAIELAERLVKIGCGRPQVGWLQHWFAMAMGAAASRVTKEADQRAREALSGPTQDLRDLCKQIRAAQNGEHIEPGGLFDKEISEASRDHGITYAAARRLVEQGVADEAMQWIIDHPGTGA